jgi:hypothetical protein
MKFTFAVVIVAVMATLAVAAPVEEGELLLLLLRNGPRF